MSDRSQPPKRRRPYVPAVGPRLQWLLVLVMGLFALIGVNSAYLTSVTFLEWWKGQTFQNYFYQYMFLGHLVLGLVLLLPFLVFAIIHIKNAHDRPNRRAVRAGYGLFGLSLALFASGLVLMRLEGFEVRDPVVRSGAYWIHVVTPLLVCWMFVLHRLAGKPIRWRIGGAWLGFTAVVALGMALLHSQDPRRWNEVGPESGLQYFFPSLSRTSTGNFIPARSLMQDAYCVECHADVHAQWENSVHKWASFNNPAYLASVRETREVSFERDGSVQAARFCAGCHDPVPFFSGAFDDPNFDDVGHETAQAGITCSVCHSITNVNSLRGNSDYTIEEPVHYPFAFSDDSMLRWVNRQLVKAKPAFHKKTFLKPLHQSAEFCGTCHKVHLPPELNDYKFLRGQNHYDPYLLSGVSGHGASSFYYPPKAVHNCNECHMQPVASDDFGAKYIDESGELKVHDHMFPSANTAIPKLVGRPDEVYDAHAKFNEGVMRLDLFGLKRGGGIEGELVAPLRPEVPTLEPGAEYLLETIIRTVKMGHIFTQGTADSNEVWVELVARIGDRVVGSSGTMDDEGNVDAWSHFVNAFVIDREGRRIDRRNAQDIFIPLYSHQIPPGAADVVHYAFELPEDAAGELEIEARLLYRKFDTTYMKFFQGEEFVRNDLPILELAKDRIVLPIAAGDGAGTARTTDAVDIPEWQRWNDYGIALLRKVGGMGKGELRGAEEAFRRVEALGRPDGPLNLARVYLNEGRLDEAVDALARAGSHDPPAPSWTVAWFSGLVNKQNGYLDEAIRDFRTVIELDDEETRRREFDFSQDYRVLGELGQTLIERSKQERGEARSAAREGYLREAIELLERVLEVDAENVNAHYNLGLAFGLLGDEERAAFHRERHGYFKPDDNARDRAIGLARSRYPAADHAADAIVIYDLQRGASDD